MSTSAPQTGAVSEMIGRLRQEVRGHQDLRLFKRFVRSNSRFRLHRSVAAISRAHCYSFFSSDLGQHLTK
jgi:hypothetical protein